MDYPGLNKLI